MTTVLLLIDTQNDFIADNGALKVPGALADTERTIKYINDNIDSLDEIIVTQDWHQKEHIAHATWWEDEHGNAPAPFTRISAEDVQNGKWKACDAERQAHSLQYVLALEQGGKYTHTIWPEHCIQDSPGAEVPLNLQQALNAWEKKHSAAVIYVKKGMNSYTEAFSALKAEVEQNNDPETGLNTNLIKHINTHDRVLVAGQALSHCVAATTKDLIAAGSGIDPKKVQVLTDCSSNVSGCEQLGTNFLKEAVQQGVTLIKSNHKLDSGTGSLVSHSNDNNQNSINGEQAPLLSKATRDKSCCLML